MNPRDEWRTCALEQRGANFADCYYREQREIDDEFDVGITSKNFFNQILIFRSSKAAVAVAIAENEKVIVISRKADASTGNINASSAETGMKITMIAMDVEAVMIGTTNLNVVLIWMMRIAKGKSLASAAMIKRFEVVLQRMINA